MDTGGSVRLTVTGPLAPYEAALRAELTRVGYAPLSVAGVVRAMARLSDWMRYHGIAPGGLTPRVVQEFLALRREVISAEGVARRGLGPLLRFLRGCGAIPRDAADEGTPVGMLLAGYRDYLLGERGLAAESVRCYIVQGRKFLAGLAQPLDRSLRRLDAAAVTSFIVGQAGRSVCVWSVKTLVTATRSLLRFLHVEGLISAPLVGAVPAVAGWRLSAVPRGLARGQVEAVLAGPDTCTPAGLRDHAVLTVLARWGLRGAEAAALGLDDVDWRAGEIIVRGKGSRVERIPLPVEVGEALAAYVTGGRPVCCCPALFVTARAPYQAMSGSTVRAIMGRACQKAGLPRLGAHRLRHSLATDQFAGRGPVDRGRAATAAPKPAEHHHLRQSRLHGVADAGTALADHRTGRRCIMIMLRQRAQEYLAMRRALGFKLTTWGAKLMSFISYLESTGAPVITTDAAVAWATSTPRASTDQVHWSRRLDVVRIFARHLKTLDAATEVPPGDILPHHYRRITPYLYSPEEITALLQAAGRLTPALRGRTWQTVLGLLAVTGMRVGEALGLDREDFNVEHGLLTVRKAKLGKSRQIPLHPTTVAALRNYLRRCDQTPPKPATAALFISTAGTRLAYASVSQTFRRLVRRVGLAHRSASCRPRLHDLRH